MYSNVQIDDLIIHKCITFVDSDLGASSLLDVPTNMGYTTIVLTLATTLCGSRGLQLPLQGDQPLIYEKQFHIYTLRQALT